MPVQPASPEISKTNATASRPSAPALHDFLSSVPPPLISVLVVLRPHIAVVRRLGQIISWQSSWYDGWLALALWWTACLFSESTVRYLLPAVLYVTLSNRKRPRISPPATEASLQATISDLTTIQSLVPALPLFYAPLATILRILAIIYVPYLIITYFVRLRVIIAVAGSLLLTWRAPWVIFVRTVLWQNPLVRRILLSAWEWLSGSAISYQFVTTGHPPSSIHKTSSSRFLFTVYENQRWWVGLDWTAALLPNERPSWCSASQHPVSPPAAFSLPETTTVVLRDDQGRNRRTTTKWRWEEGDEWSVLVKKEGQPQARVARPLPKEDAHATVSGAMMSKVASKMRESSPPPANAEPDGSSLDAKVAANFLDEEENHDDESDMLTDGDGWIYGDNKWERQSGKGGYSKYTRYRRWTRIAVADENTEILHNHEIEPGIQRTQRHESNTNADSITTTHEGEISHSMTGQDLYDVSSPPQGVRQRIKTALARRSIDSSGSVPPS